MNLIQNNTDLILDSDKFQVDCFFIWTESLKKQSNFEEYLLSHLGEIAKEKKTYISH